MIFTSPKWLPEPPAIPDDLTAGDFVLSRYGSFYDWSDEKPSVICATSGRSYDISELKSRVDLLARGLLEDLGWKTEPCSIWNSVIALFSINTIDFMIISWAIHRIGGVCLLLHPTSTTSEIRCLLKSANCRIVFTNSHLMSLVEDVDKQDALKMFLTDTLCVGTEAELSRSSKIMTVEDLIKMGRTQPSLARLKMKPGEARERVAYLCPTSGTSGKQKLARLTHYNIVANCMLAALHENIFKKGRTECSLGVLPLSHSYTLIIGHLTAWRGDTLVLHGRFDLQNVLASIVEHRIERLYLVPSIVQALVKNSFLFEMFDLSSVETVVTGSSSFGPSMVHALKAVQPNWHVQPGYGLTESGVIASFTIPGYECVGSDGCLLSSTQARLISDSGVEIDAHESPGELLLKSPSIMQGYHGDDLSTAMVLEQNGWLRTGDIAFFRQDGGASHLFIVDRMKDIMKVKGMQVAPVEIEAHLMKHPAVAEAAVIAIRDEDAGERPFAFVVRSDKVLQNLNEVELRNTLREHVGSSMSESHWLRDNISFLKEIPKSHNGKALKFKLKELMSN